MTKKIPISFSEEDVKQIKELTELMGIAGVYGDLPKAVKYSINLALSASKFPEKIYTDLDEAKLVYYFSSLRKAELKARLLKKVDNLKIEVVKV